MPGFFESKIFESCPWYLSTAKGSGCEDREKSIVGGERRDNEHINRVFYFWYFMTL